MFKDVLQGMMNAEFNSSMDILNMIKHQKKNYRNGSTKKKLKSEFESKIVPKNKRDV